MFFDELKTGMTVQTQPVVMERSEMLGFAQKYDNVPLHTDVDYAKNTPFGQLLAPGMLTFLAVWAEYLKLDFFGEELLAGTSQKIEWHKPVFAGDVLTGICEITALQERSMKNGLAQLTIRVFRGEDLVLTGITECIVKRRQYCFYGWEAANVPNVSGELPAISTPRALYDALTHIWCEYTCATRLREKWSPKN
ncbi:MAG: MaoC family dehydratase N-terminal domain-containing protein, partial [Oscillospiraceae bacterium]|nr:MaoC family dehydratase N-terminal domain-containing protein [Oscillospiraceae bacterium]